ncbi:MAG: hypothetical protein KA354_15055 [Phycisphaerae bacterium]|nr:hypothetical protein [Phycisphaerae bacterium]
MIGQLGIRGQPKPPTPTIRIIIVRNLTAASYGNAVGIGLAEITTRRLCSKPDFRATYENALTSACLERATVPMVAETDRQALDFALQATSPQDANTARIIRIHNTLRIDQFLASPAVLEELKSQPGIEVLGRVEPVFDEQVNMTADLTP